MRTNFKVSFYLRSNYENKEGKSPVMLRVFLNGEMANFGSTKIFVDKTVWNNATSRLKGRTAEALSANAALDSISTMLNNIYHKFEDDESLSLDKIRSFFVGKRQGVYNFPPCIRQIQRRHQATRRTHHQQRQPTKVQRFKKTFFRIPYS